MLNSFVVADATTATQNQQQGAAESSPAVTTIMPQLITISGQVNESTTVTNNTNTRNFNAQTAGSLNLLTNPIAGTQQQFNIFTSTSPANTATIPIVLNENQLPFFFILYEMKTGQIVNIMRNTSSQLLYAFENFQDYFSLSSLDNITSDYPIPFINDIAAEDGGSYYRRPIGTSFSFHTLPSNNIYAKQTFLRHIKTISKLNNSNELTKCLLSQLPISSQSFAHSPYLDHSLYSYDEKLINSFERPKPIGDQTIKFNFRETGHLAFRIHTGQQSNPSIVQQTHKRLVAFIWHPREPFCISVQRAAHEYNVNFHIYTKNHLIYSNFNSSKN
jgi:hypothetical protein